MRRERGKIQRKNFFVRNFLRWQNLATRTNSNASAACGFRNSCLTFIGVVCVAILFTQSNVAAHDPYEITTEIRLETNLTRVEIEMELAAAISLASMERPNDTTDVPSLFTKALPELQRQAGGFLQLGSAGVQITATRTNVSLGVENHVKFSLQFPVVRGGLRVNAAGLKSLGPQGPFGTTVTVLDLVNMKVLGQSVLFPDSPVAQFDPAVKTEAVAAVASKSPEAPATNPAPTAMASTTAGRSPPAACCNGRWVLLLAVVLAAATIWAIRRR